jgi:hypothetical protein
MVRCVLVGLPQISMTLQAACVTGIRCSIRLRLAFRWCLQCSYWAQKTTNSQTDDHDDFGSGHSTRPPPDDIEYRRNTDQRPILFMRCGCIFIHKLLQAPGQLLDLLSLLEHCERKAFLISLAHFLSQFGG